MPGRQGQNRIYDELIYFIRHDFLTRKRLGLYAIWFAFANQKSKVPVNMLFNSFLHPKFYSKHLIRLIIPVYKKQICTKDRIFLIRITSSLYHKNRMNRKTSLTLIDQLSLLWARQKRLCFDRKSARVPPVFAGYCTGIDR